MKLPNRLQKGDCIGVISPSDPIIPEKLEHINASILLLEQAGFTIRFAKNAFSNTLGYSATVQEKVEDIHSLFEDEEVKAIFCSTGGFNSNSLWEVLDYNKIANHPKILCGFSDSTSLLNQITAKTGMITFHGPTFKSLTSWDTDYGYQEVRKRLVEGRLELGQPQDEDITIQEGVGEGRLVGGNLSLFSEFVSGKEAIDFSDKILFLEETGMESNPAMVSHFLYRLKQNGVFQKVKGIWLGNYEHVSKISLEKILLDVLEKEINLPIIKSNYFGHTDKKTVIPIGTMAKIDTTQAKKIVLLEECVK